MNATMKSGVIVVIVAVLAAGYYYWYTTHASQDATMQSDSTALPTGSNSSDAALEQDLSSIGTNMQATSADSTAVNASVDAQASSATN